MSDNPGRFVHVSEDNNTFKYVQNIEQNYAYVQPVTYVRSSVRPVRVRGKGYAVTVRVPKALGDVLRANPVPVAGITFLGKVGVTGSSVIVRGVRVLKAKMYVAPLPEGYSAVAQLANTAIELSNRGVPWSAAMYGYRMGRGGQYKAILLLPVALQYVQEKHGRKGRAVRVNKVRIFLWQDLVPGFYVGEVYQFNLGLMRASA